MTRCAALLLVAAALLVIGADPAFAQCAMCRRALQSPEGQQMIGAFRSAIMFLLAAPFAVFGAVATLAVRRLRGTAAPAGHEPRDDGMRPHGFRCHETARRAE